MMKENEYRQDIEARLAKLKKELEEVETLRAYGHSSNSVELATVKAIRLREQIKLLEKWMKQN